MGWDRIDIIAEPGSDVYTITPANEDRLVVAVRPPGGKWSAYLSSPVNEDDVTHLKHRCVSLVHSRSPLAQATEIDSPPEVLPLTGEEVDPNGVLYSTGIKADNIRMEKCLLRLREWLKNPKCGEPLSQASITWLQDVVDHACDANVPEPATIPAAE